MRQVPRSGILDSITAWLRTAKPVELGLAAVRSVARIKQSQNIHMRIIGSPEELGTQSAVEVVVPDLRATLDFYRQLGFIVERETPTFVTLRWDSVFLFIAQNDKATTALRWTNVRIVVDNVDTIWKRVQRLKLPVGSSIADRPYGLRDFTVKDPAGFEIRFAQVIV